MDEADKLCDRIAIVDHGELKALDSPLKLKASIPGKNVIEASFGEMPAGWVDALKALPHVDGVAGEDHVFRISSDNGPATTMALVDTAARLGVAVQSLSVQSTTLDDVFVHYAGRALRDALQEANPMDRQGFMVRRQKRSGFSGQGSRFWLWFWCWLWLWFWFWFCFWFWLWFWFASGVVVRG